MTQYSYSRVDTFTQCQYKYKLRYIDGIKVEQDITYDNPLILGTTLHECIQQDLETGMEYYFNQFSIISDLQINEMFKLETLYPKILETLPKDKGLVEVKVETKDFIGFLDWLVPVDSNTYDLYDFKYSKNAERYKDSKQLHIYKYYFELMTGKHIRNMYFLVVPKTAIRQKKDETLFSYRERLKETLDGLEIALMPIEYDFNKVLEYQETIKEIENTRDFHKNITRLCDYCEYQNECCMHEEEKNK